MPTSLDVAGARVSNGRVRIRGGAGFTMDPAGNGMARGHLAPYGRPMTFAAALPGALTRARRDLGRARHNAAFLAAGLPVHLAVALLWLWLVGCALGAPAAVPLPVAALLVVTPALTAAERWRCRALAETVIPAASPQPGRPGLRRVAGWLRSPESWRQAGYFAVFGPLFAVTELLALATWVAGIGASTFYIWVWALPEHAWLTNIGYTIQAAYLTAAGLAALCIAPGLGRSVVRLQTWTASALLGPTRARQLQRRIGDLAQSRAGAVDAADAERRRIERDLHDGVQQRLVSLAVNLGLAQANLSGLSDDARLVIDDAHREAKEAIAELGALVRGLHPAVLDDRGLDAALSGLVARAPLPVGLSVQLNERPSATVESVAYFVVSEALTNITKHARATRAEVIVERSGDVLRVTVTDDGRGGADAAGGTGLTGLAGRVASVDGIFAISSPAQGPTIVTADMPCGP
jgi:signal transduction histidine kinase